MKIKKSALLYDIQNLAFVIADNNDNLNHGLHRVRDICQDGNLDRVSRMLNLAYAEILNYLAPILIPPSIDLSRDYAADPHDYELIWTSDTPLATSITPEIKMKIKESCHEYMVCRVLADWLTVTFPEAAEEWKLKTQETSKSLKEICGLVTNSGIAFLHRTISPF